MKRDDRLALNTLFTRYYTRLCSFANNFVRNQDDAEEIVSDVFINLWKRRHTMEITRSLRAYLYVSVRHAAFAKIKTRQANFINIDDAFEASELVENYGPMEALTLDDLQNQLQEIINRLPPRCRQIFILKWTEGLTYKEIGETMEISEKTVENQVIKAFDMIRKSIKKFQSA